MITSALAELKRALATPDELNQLRRAIIELASDEQAALYAAGQLYATAGDPLARPLADLLHAAVASKGAEELLCRAGQVGRAVLERQPVEDNELRAALDQCARALAFLYGGVDLDQCEGPEDRACVMAMREAYRVLGANPTPDRLSGGDA